MYDVSVIVLCYNRLEYTKACINSRLKHSPENTEIVIVDNNSTDGTRDWLKTIHKKYNHVKIILNDDNYFPAKGNKIGLKNASDARFYLLCDNDGMFYSDEWYHTAKKMFDNLPDMGLINMRESRWRKDQKKFVTCNYLGIDYYHTTGVASFSALRPKVAKFISRKISGRWIGHVIGGLTIKSGYNSIRLLKGLIYDQSDNDMNNPKYRDQYERLWEEKGRMYEFNKRVNKLNAEQGKDE